MCKTICMYCNSIHQTWLYFSFRLIMYIITMIGGIIIYMDYAVMDIFTNKINIVIKNINYIKLTFLCKLLMSIIFY